MIQATINNPVATYSKLVRHMDKDQRLMATHISLFTALFADCPVP